MWHVSAHHNFGVNHRKCKESILWTIFQSSHFEQSRVNDFECTALLWFEMKAFTYIYILIQIVNVSTWDRVGSTVYLLHYTINLVLYFNSEGKRSEVRFLIWFGNCKKVLNVIIASKHILSSIKSWHNDKFKYIITSSDIGLQCIVAKIYIISYSKYKAHIFKSIWRSELWIWT